MEMCLPDATVAHANKEEKRVGRRRSPVPRQADVLSQGLEGHSLARCAGGQHPLSAPHGGAMQGLSWRSWRWDRALARGLFAVFSVWC